MRDHDIIEVMSSLGGSFARALAGAYRRADLENQRRIREAFPELWAEYRVLSDEMRKRELVAEAAIKEEERQKKEHGE
jgi:hypothetical protein